jgi:hypothetical protein
LQDQFPGGSVLLREESQWWERAKWESYARRFAEVHAFPRVKTCRGLADLPRLYRETAGRTRAIGALPINPEADMILCLASVVGLSNAVVSAHPEVYKILCASKKSYTDLTRHGDRLRFRFTTSSWLQNRVIEPLVGLERTLHYKPRLNPGGDGVRLVRLEKDPADLYDAIVVMSNSGRELPPGENDRLIAARFPGGSELLEISATESAGEQRDRKRRVLFFGTPFLLIHNLPPKVYAEHLNRCLDYIRRHHGGHCELVYRPHPIETTEVEQLNLEGFRIENDREAAELYFLRHFAEIEAVYSVSSTVSRTALNYGLNAYSLWRSFPFPQTAAEYFEKVMGDVPPEFDIRDLAQPPLAYQASRITDAGARGFSEGLKMAAEMRAKVSVTR